MNSKLTFARSFAWIALCFFAINGFSQSGIPEGILFQAIAKDPSGVPARGRVIHIKDVIKQSTVNGTVAYSETFVITASDEGVFTISIGQGTRVAGAAKLSAIDWGAGPYFLNLQAAIEPSIVTPEWKVDEQYVDMGTSQFWTVPFAFRAASVSGFELLLKATDTTAMLAPYLRKSDTSSLSNRINLNLKTVDTTTMLSSYLRKTDTAGMFGLYVKRNELNGMRDTISGKLNITDTSSMLHNYASKDALTAMLDTLSGKLNNRDTSSMLSTYAKLNALKGIRDTLSGKLNIADTSSMLRNYASKEALIAILDTLSGKLNNRDTSSMLSTYAKLNALAGIRDTLSRKLNSIDTLSMLSNYARKNELAGMRDTLTAKLNIADTGLLLSPYYKSATAVSELAQKESIANKSANTNLGNSDILYPTQKAVKNYVDSMVAGGSTADASAVAKGKLKLAGDLSGTADLPLVGDGKITNSKIADSAVSYAKMQNVNAGKLLGNPSSAKGTVSEITIGTGLSFSGNTLNAQPASGLDTFTSNIIVYSTNGLGKYTTGQTIPAIGKTAKQVLVDALTQTIAPTYVQPGAGISSNPAAGIVEIGSALSVTLSSSFTQNDAGAQTGTVFFRNGSPLGTNTDNIVSLTSVTSYTATVSYGQGPVKNNNLGTPDPAGQINAGSKNSGTISFTPQAKRYWGYSSSSNPTDAEIKAVLGGGAELTTVKAKASFDITISSGSNYVFFAYPSVIGPLGSLSVGGFGSLPAFTQTTRSFTNASGYAQSYFIYVSQNTFSTTVSNIVTN